MQSNNNSTDPIKDILDSISGKGSDSLNTHEDEFVFGAADEPKGLVFDDTPHSEEEPEKETEKSQPKLNFEISDEAAKKPVELAVPEKFQPAEKYDTPSYEEEKPRIFTTYVPRFTDASLNYRMKGERRPEFVKVENGKETDSAPEEKIDPTAEIYSEDISTEAVKVSVNKSEPDALESASQVFKFLENELPQEAPGAETVTVEEEPREERIEENRETESNDEVSSPKEYSIPDPVRDLAASSTAAITNYSAKTGALEDAPEDVGDRALFDKGDKTAEYTSYAQRDSFKDKFLDVIMSIRVRFFAAAAITLLLIIVESMVAFGVDIVRIFRLETIPGALALLDAQFVICLYLIAIPETAKAFKRLSKKKAVPELYVSLSFAVFMAYTVIIAVTAPKNYPLFGLLFAVVALAAIGAAYFKKSAEFTAFKQISINEEKQIIDSRLTRSLERENAALDGAVEEHKSKIMRIFRTVFVSNFFKRSEKCAEKSSNVALLLLAPLGAALVTGTVVFFVPGGIDKAAAAFTLVFMLAVPAMSLLMHKLPFYAANREAGAEKSAFIGESALYDLAGTDVITFDDTEVFGPDDVTLQRIMLYGHSDNLTKALRQMSSLFMNVGGPLDRLFSDALDRKSSAASNTYIEDGGIYGEIDSHPALAGTLEYMMEKGVSIPDDEAQRQEKLSDSIKVMYAALDGEVYAKFYIRYSFSEEFSMLLPTLEDEGIKSLVYTSDPNITDELIKALTAGPDNIRVMRRYVQATHTSVVYREVSAGTVTFGEKSNAINTVILAKKYARIESRLAITELIAMTVGGVLGILLSLGGMLLVPSVALAIWQSAWCGVLHVVSVREFRFSKKKKGN